MESLVSADSPTAYGPTQQLRRIKWLHRLLHHRLFVPLGLTERAIRGLKFLWNPAQVRRRRSIAQALEKTEDDSVLSRYGYLRLTPASLPGLDVAMECCRTEFEGSMASGALADHASGGPKPFLVSAIKDEEVLRFPDLFAFVVSPSVVELAAKYFGAVPVLSGLRLWYTPPNDTLTDSQLFHCDREDQKQFKLLLNVLEVTPESGPFTLIPADVSARVKRALKYSYRNYRLADEDIAAAGGLDSTIALTGPPGAGACVDTSRCLHYGSRGNTRERLVLMIQFTDCLAPNVTVPAWHKDLARLDIELSETQLLVLGAAGARSRAS